MRTVFRWLDSNEEFRRQYARAREVQGHVLFDMSRDEAMTATDAQLGRLRYDALKWQASKLVPKVYGDKMTQELTGVDGGPIEVAAIRRVVVDPKLTADE